MEARCRLCAEVSLELISLIEDPQCSERIFQLFNIKIDLADRLPLAICRICWETVQNTWLYFEKVIKAQEVLIDIFNSVSVNAADPLAFDPADNSPKIIECIITNNTLHPIKEEDKLELESISINDNAKKEIQSKSKKSADDDELSVASDYEPNEDDSIHPKANLLGWDCYRWFCAHCQQHFITTEDLRQHYSTIHKQSPRYYCVECLKIYSKYGTFVAHVKQHRPHLKFCCDICYKWFKTAAIQEKHRANAHADIRPHTCKHCGKKFRMQSALAVHERSHLPAELKNRYQCDQCPKRFGTKPNLVAHKRIHFGIKNYTCDQCGKGFVQKGNLDNHLLTHTAVRPFICKTCGKGFKTMMRLKKHESIHLGLKPHRCEICGKNFRERGTLREHQRIHTGAMPYTCDICGKNFRFKGVLTTHRRQHTGERPYSCQECQHHFTNWPNYNKHMKRRHGINTSVTVRKPQAIPPTGMPNRNPPGTILAPPQPLDVEDNFVESPPTFYPALGLYIPEELLQQRV